MEELPDEVLLEIVRRVVLVRSCSTRGEEAECAAAAVLRDVGSLSRVSSRWRAVLETDSLWRDLYKHRWMNHNRHLVREQGHPQINQQFEASFNRAHKPLCWKAFYLREVRRPMTELLRGVDWDSLRLSKLGWTGLQDSPLARSEEDSAVRELRAASRSERLREALASYPPAFRRRLRERLEMLHVRCSFLHRIQSALFLAKVGLGVYAVRRLAPSLCPLPERFVSTRRLPAGAASALAVLAGFWPLLSYTAAYSLVQYQLGAKSYLGGCGRNWRLCAAKFGVRVLHSVLEEIGLRPFVVALVATNGLLKAVTFIIALLGSYAVLETLNQHSTRRAPSDDTKISMFSFAVACYVARFDLVLGTVSTLVLPLFHRLTRNAYRDVITGEAGSAPSPRPPQPYLHLFVLGLFAVSSLAQLSHAPPWLTEKLATAAAGWRPTTRVWDYLSGINTSRQPAAFFLSLRGSLAALTTAPHVSRSDESQSEAKRQLGECLRAVHGHVVGWVMCHAALRHGLPTAVALKLVYEVELLLCQLAVKAVTWSRSQSTP